MSDRKRVITLTNAPPVSIRHEEWPAIVFSKWYPGGARKGWMYIRRHSDGRTLVYAGLDTRLDTPHPGERALRAGELVAAGSPDLGDAIARVAAAVGADHEFAQNMIARLPPVEI